ncbi:hypothetical protein B0A49_05188 [Cryomyces minteri]|uniref:D-aminoacyl-tRNA deacylase n=1 Tax=Cryomyces minteri TaxID=331657 RepID=A0A4U0XBY1_9PEZI|nr:hypothetical protein B0A49_05188 [Cryomyces minteri]
MIQQARLHRYITSPSSHHLWLNLFPAIAIVQTHRIAPDESRVKSASVTVDEQLVSTIGKGLLVFAAVGKDDTQKEAEKMAEKILKVKMWDDDKGGRWRWNVQDICGEVLCVSQFTLLASTDKGSKPSFHRSANGETARKLYDAFYSKIESLYTPDKVKNGVFQAMMDAGLVNDGPVTIEINTDPPKMDNPTGFEANGDGGTLKTKIHKTFTLPAELLEDFGLDSGVGVAAVGLAWRRGTRGWETSVSLLVGFMFDAVDDGDEERELEEEHVEGEEAEKDAVEAEAAQEEEGQESKLEDDQSPVAQARGRLVEK